MGRVGGSAATLARHFSCLGLAATTTMLTLVAAVEIRHPCGQFVDVNASASADALYFMLFFDKTGSTSVADVVRKRVRERFVDAGCSRPNRPPMPADPLIWWRWAMYGGFDNCALLAPRPCAYVTVLRDPVARLLSAYNYFCRACAEFGRQCGREHPDTLKCPHMTLEAYAAAFQDIYTRAFAGAPVVPDEKPAILLGAPARPEDLDVAKRWISRWRVLVLFTEDFQTAQYPLRAVGSLLGLPGLAQITQMPHSNPASRVAHLVPTGSDAGLASSSSSNATASEQTALTSIRARYFSYDTQLYDWLRTEYIQPTQ